VNFRLHQYKTLTFAQILNHKVFYFKVMFYAILSLTWRLTQSQWAVFCFSHNTMLFNLLSRTFSIIFTSIIIWFFSNFMSHTIFSHRYQSLYLWSNALINCNKSNFVCLWFDLVSFFPKWVNIIKFHVNAM